MAEYSNTNIVDNNIDSPNDLCWATGVYNSNCDCYMCEHQYECSGSTVDNDEED